MSQWKLVEANVEGPGAQTAPAVEVPKENAPAKRSRGRRTRKPRSGSTTSQDEFYTEEYAELSKEDLNYACHLMTQAIDEVFSSDSLAQEQGNTLRMQMDCEGYIPLEYVLQYPSQGIVGSLAVHYYDQVMESIQKSSFLLEGNVTNGCVRLKENWANWLLPNQETGAKGLSLWTPLPVDVDAQAAAAVAEALAAPVERRERGLSIDAPAFTPKV